jgi:hypothetical protein
MGHPAESIYFKDSRNRIEPKLLHSMLNSHDHIDPKLFHTMVNSHNHIDPKLLHSMLNHHKPPISKAYWSQIGMTLGQNLFPFRGLKSFIPSRSQIAKALSKYECLFLKKALFQVWISLPCDWCLRRPKIQIYIRT